MTPREVLLSDHYTEVQVAEAFGISVKGLRERKCRGLAYPPYIKVGREKLYPKKEFHAWVKKIKVNHPIAN